MTNASRPTTARAGHREFNGRSLPRWMIVLDYGKAPAQTPFARRGCHLSGGPGCPLGGVGDEGKSLRKEPSL